MPHKLPAMPFRVCSMLSLGERRLLFTLPAALLHLVYGLLCRERGVPFEPFSAPRTRFGIMCFPRRRAAPGLPLRTRGQFRHGVSSLPEGCVVPVSAGGTAPGLPLRARDCFGIMCFSRRGCVVPVSAGAGDSSLSAPDTANGFPIRRSSAWGTRLITALYFTQVSFSRSPAGFYPRHRDRGPPHGRASG